MRVSTSHGSSNVQCLSCRPSTLARRLRPVAVPMSQLPVRVRLSPTYSAWDDVLHFQHIVGLEITSAVTACPRLPRQQRGYARGDARIMPPSCAPIHLIVIVGAAPCLHRHVPADRPLDVERSPPPTPSRGAVQSVVFTPPVPLLAPFPVLVRMTNPDPRPHLLAQRVVHLREGLLTPDRGEVVAPPPDHRIQHGNQACLPRHAMTTNARDDLSLVLRHGPTACPLWSETSGPCRGLLPCARR